MTSVSCSTIATHFPVEIDILLSCLLILLTLYYFIMTDELTNLNWLCSITTAKSCSPLASGLNNTTATTSAQHRDKPRLKVLLPSSTTATSIEAPKTNNTSQRRLYHINNDTKHYPLVITSKGFYSRPSCSYSCLIAMALKASSTGCLPVHEIYRFVEQEYPFYKTAPEGWKNSIRHNLSMNQNFIKVQRPDGFQTKKGYYWAANPTRQHVLDLEIERALKTMGRNLIENSDLKQLYHSSMDISIVQSSPDITTTDTSTEERELQDDNGTPLLLDIIQDTSHASDNNNLDGFNLIAGIKTPMGKHFPILIKKESSLVHLCAIKSDDDALKDLFGTSLFNNEEQKSIKQRIAGTKRQCTFLPTSSYLPLTKKTNIAVRKLNEKSNRSSTNIPDYIKPFIYCIMMPPAENDNDYNDGEVEEDILTDDDEEEEEEDDDDSFIVEDNELCEILKICSNESVGDHLQEENEESSTFGPAIVLTEADEGYLMLEENKELLQCNKEINTICQELYNEDPSIVARLPDISTKEKAMEFITCSSPAITCTQDESLPVLELDEYEWPIGEENMTVLNDSDTKDIDF